MNATKERQAWCCLQVKLCDPCLSALCVPWCEKALYKYSSFPFPFPYRPPGCARRSSDRLRTRGVCMRSDWCSLMPFLGPPTGNHALDLLRSLFTDSCGKDTADFVMMTVSSVAVTVNSTVSLGEAGSANSPSGPPPSVAEDNLWGLVKQGF